MVMEQTKLNRRNPEPELRQHFNEVSAKFSSGFLLIDEATDAINFMLKKFGIAYVVSGDEFEEVLLDISTDIEVSEDTFVAAYDKILPFASLGAAERLVEDYMTLFDKFMRGRTTTRLLYATRVLQRAWIKNHDTGLLIIWPIPDENLVKEKMAKFDRDQDGKLTRVEFVCAALSIVHGMEKSFDDEIFQICHTKQVQHFPFEFEFVVT